MVVRAEARKIGVLPGYTEILDEYADLDVLVLVYSITRLRRYAPAPKDLRDSTGSKQFATARLARHFLTFQSA